MGLKQSGDLCNSSLTASPSRSKVIGFNIFARTQYLGLFNITGFGKSADDDGLLLRVKLFEFFRLWEYPAFSKKLSDGKYLAEEYDRVMADLIQERFYAQIFLNYLNRLPDKLPEKRKQEPPVSNIYASTATFSFSSDWTFW